jgi:F-type H+-transporting ATPase subunit delta
MGGATARRYARALFAAASGQNAVDAIAEQLASLHQAFADGEARALVLSPEVPAGVRRRALEKLAGHSHPLLRNLVQVVLERRREAVLPDLQPAFQELVRAARGELSGVISTARPLGEASWPPSARRWRASTANTSSCRSR